MEPKYCSPNNRKNKYSCFSNKSLLKIAAKYNTRYYNDKIEMPKKLTYKNREKFWNKLKTKIAKNTECKNEHCWLNLDFIQNIRDKNVHNTFRPEMPEKWNSDKTTWLSTVDIEQVLKQYELNSDFYFIGAVPMDFDKEISIGGCVINELCKLNVKKLFLSGIRKLGFVFNLDPHDKPGSHWVSMYVDLNNGGIYYFDSYAKPPTREVQKLMERIRKQGNELIKKKFIDFEKFSNEHAITTRYNIKSKKEVTIPKNVNIQLDTPTTIVDNRDNLMGKIFNINNPNYKGGGDEQIIRLKAKTELISNGQKLLQKGFRKFYNNIRFQYKGTECGVYSIYIIEQLLKGKTFYSVIKNIIDDNTINRQRGFYYRPN